MSFLNNFAMRGACGTHGGEERNAALLKFTTVASEGTIIWEFLGSLQCTQKPGAKRGYQSIKCLTCVRDVPSSRPIRYAATQTETLNVFSAPFHVNAAIIFCNRPRQFPGTVFTVNIRPTNDATESVLRR